MSSRREAWRFLIVFGLLSLACIAIGCFVARASGVPAGVWTRNLVAWIVGGLAAAGLAKSDAGRSALVFAVVAVVGLVVSLLSAGQQGVHRWVDIGPAHLNAAELLLPAAVVAIAALLTHRLQPWVLGATINALLIAQPDASQATASGAALSVLIATAPRSGRWKAGGAVLLALAVVAAWLRADPLAPVPEVEGIMGLAWSLSPAAAILAWAAMVGTILSPMLLSRAEEQPVRTAAIALTLYAIGSALTPLAGAFPVPLVGMGVSPILGFWLGAGLLAAVARRSRQAPPP